jgi:hypothetical protein
LHLPLDRRARIEKDSPKTQTARSARITRVLIGEVLCYPVSSN